MPEAARHKGNSAANSPLSGRAERLFETIGADGTLPLKSRDMSVSPKCTPLTGMNKSGTAEGLSFRLLC